MGGINAWWSLEPSNNEKTSHSLVWMHFLKEKSQPNNYIHLRQNQNSSLQPPSIESKTSFPSKSLTPAIGIDKPKSPGNKRAVAEAVKPPIGSASERNQVWLLSNWPTLKISPLNLDLQKFWFCWPKIACLCQKGTVFIPATKGRCCINPTPLKELLMLARRNVDRYKPARLKTPIGLESPLDVWEFFIKSVRYIRRVGDFRSIFTDRKYDFTCEGNSIQK